MSIFAKKQIAPFDWKSIWPDIALGWQRLDMLDARLECAARGWYTFPAPADGEKKSHKSAEFSNGIRWGATIDPDEIRRDFEKWPDANIGIAMEESGIFVVEADTLLGHNVDGLASMRKLEAEHGTLPETLMAESPTGSPHRFYNVPPGVKIPGTESKVADGVDVKGAGGMVIAPPSIRPGVGRYRWLNDAPVVDAPQWLVDAVIAAAAHEGDATEHVSNGDLEAADHNEAAAALAAIPNDSRYDSWGAWNSIAMMVWAATGGDEVGRLAFDAWSQRWAGCGTKRYNVKETRERWKALSRSPPTEKGMGSLVHLANEANPNWRDEYYAEARKHGEQAKASMGFGSQARAEEAKPEATQPPAESWPIMRPEAYYGFAGQLVETIEPHSESDPVALLIQFLVCFGNIVGRNKFFLVENTRHHMNLFTALLGVSSKGRKGTSFNHIKAIMRDCEPDWTKDHMTDGLSSGEGLINVVRDETKGWDVKDQQWTIRDPGVEDKRLIVVEPEFASVLSVMERSGNTISHLLRKAWDDGDLETKTKVPLRATGAHISLIGHVTVDELRARLTRTDMGNGFANRFLFMLVQRSKELPFGGELDDAAIRRLGWSLKAIQAHGRVRGRVGFTPAAAELWGSQYHDLSAAHDGLLGAITSRAEAQAVRLALIYAMLDQADAVDVLHLQAALAVQQYAFDSAAYVFGRSLGDVTADTILRALQANTNGLSRTAISTLFSNHKDREKIGQALALLLAKGLARMETRKTGGAPVEIWFATGVSK